MLPKAVFLFILVVASGDAVVASPQKGATTVGDEMRQEMEMFNALRHEIDERLRSAKDSGNPLAELQALRALDTEFSARGPEAKHAVATLLMSMAAEVGNYEEALRYADASRGRVASGTSMDLSSLAGYEPVDALDAVSKLSDSAQFVLINEAHHVPQHRALSIELLKALRPRGFTHFAAETLFARDHGLNERGYPTKKTGAYTDEPVYADLIRTALDLGYRVVPYEWTGEYTLDKRERGQAKNLVDRIQNENPKAKVVVHAGYSHINESGTFAGAKTMAQRLKEMTGLDPLTIDQTVMTERWTPEYEHGLYRSVIEKKRISVATVFRNAKGEVWTLEPGKRDVTIFHPRSGYQDGRPTWLRLGGDRQAHELPDDVCGSEERCLVRARFADESVDAIPIDQVEVVAGQSIPVLMLPRGEFVVEVKDTKNKTIRSSRIELQFEPRDGDECDV